jgi:hypothetical protein
MKIENEILINKYGQNLISHEELVTLFAQMNFKEKKNFLGDFLFLIMQSKPKEDDIYSAIIESKLKPTFTPCIILNKGVANHNLRKIIELPENELNKSFILLLSLFRIAYKRRFEIEKNSPGKWWYWDLSDNKNIQQILIKQKNNLFN